MKLSGAALTPGPGRKKGFKHTAIVRERIRVSMIVSRLHRHVLGDLEMSQTQLRAAEILLKKALPDLSSVEHTGEILHRSVQELSNEELLAIAAGGRAGTAAEGSGDADDLPVH